MDAEGGASLLRVRSVDLSATGLKMVTNSELELGQTVRLNMHAGEPPEPVRTDATVVRIDDAPDGGHRYELEFSPLDRHREQQVVQAVFAHEQVNVGRHAQVRMTVWIPVTIEPRGGKRLNAHASALSSDDVLIVSRHALEPGTCVRVQLQDVRMGLDLRTDAVVAETDTDLSGITTCTLEFNSLDRVTRATILRHTMESERRDLAGEI